MVQVKRPTANRWTQLRYQCGLILAVFFLLLFFATDDEDVPALRRGDSIRLIPISSQLDLPLEAMKQAPNKHRLLDFEGEAIELRSAFMPAVGYGTCCRKTAKGEVLYESALSYLQAGGRLIDTAMAYGNHAEIGRALKDSGLDREQIWITSKISPNKLTKEHANIKESTVLKAVVTILEELGTEYLDLCLIHTPKLGQEPTIEIWKGIIEAQKLGLFKVIGVSNFNRLEIMDLYQATQVLPEVNQIQYHPWTSPEWKQLVEWQHRHKIATTAYTSLGGSRFDKSTWPLLLTELADKYEATPSQLLLRWALQQKVAVIPGSASPEHIRENWRIPSFVISATDVQQLELADAPQGWFDAKRGPNKYVAHEANVAWQGDHSVPKQ